ncbi:MAG TPA: 5'/3'-nucleotidase SurE [Chthoniobacterales bacterium]
MSSGGTLEKEFWIPHRGLEVAELPGGSDPEAHHTLFMFLRQVQAAALQNGPFTAPFVPLWSFRMMLLLTNDDGIDAPGLAALGHAARALGHDAVVVAPATHQSWCSHTITAHRGVRVERRAGNRFAVHGTPADCVRIGLLRLAPEADWVLSGINHGANLGADVYYSGTVAAVREAVLHGWPGVALSHYRRKGMELDDWERVTPWATSVLADLLARPTTPGLFYSVNLPHLESNERKQPRTVLCPLDPNPLPLSYRHEVEGDQFYYEGTYTARRRNAGADMEVCLRGDIAVTELRLF